MSYELKTVNFQNRNCTILLQNENGPCPLIAVANALILRGNIKLPKRCIKTGTCTLEDLSSLLVEKAIGSNSSADDSTQQHFINDMLESVPNFQYGMDVNLYFCKGCNGYEYTAALTALDMLKVQLVHGWLVDPVNQAETYSALETKSYNQLVEIILASREVKAEMEAVKQELLNAKAEQQLQKNKKAIIKELTSQYQDLSNLQTQGHLIDEFLQSTSHQLTQYGLQALHEYVKENELVVFFRNNHFSTMTKHDGQLYLLVTDLGFKNQPDCIWEKFDMIDGDTEYVTSGFCLPGKETTANTEADLDRQVALGVQMKRRLKINGPNDMSGDESDVIAAATEASLREYYGVADVKTSKTSSKTRRGRAKTSPQEAADAALAKDIQRSAMEELDSMIAQQIAANMDYDDRMAYRAAAKLQDEECTKVYELRSTTRNPNTPGVPCVIQ